MSEAENPDAGKQNEVKETAFQFFPWTITVRKSHILQSKCKSPEKCKRNDSDDDSNANMCAFCRYDKELSLPQLPDMVFGDNLLRIDHIQGKYGIEFSALDALKLVDANQDSGSSLKVAVAKAWQEARADSGHLTEVRPFDWTFTTQYKGTLTGSDGHKLISAPTDRRIDIEKLKQQEKILFYEAVDLFEDELADNGAAMLFIKIRVMPSGMFILQRFYLRVDNRLVRVHDTRIHYEANSTFLLREFSVREANFSELENIPHTIITDPNEIGTHLKLKLEESEILTIPMNL